MVFLLLSYKVIDIGYTYYEISAQNMLAQLSVVAIPKIHQTTTALLDQVFRSVKDLSRIICR